MNRRDTSCICKRCVSGFTWRANWMLDASRFITNTLFSSEVLKNFAFSFSNLPSNSSDLFRNALFSRSLETFNERRRGGSCFFASPVPSVGSTTPTENGVRGTGANEYKRLPRIIRGCGVQKNIWTF